MSVSLSLFPILDENIYMKIGFEASFNFITTIREKSAPWKSRD